MNVIKQAQGDEATVRMGKRTTVGTPYSSVYRTFLFAGPFWFRIQHIVAHVNTVCLDD